ncbi:uncharacterized protein [Dendropsophus ebraccatus]|uniref:uncharacterized protein n=1 Tax=Dendropsophus ebraccatus TaxID=150705 RepID=UPI0038314EC4
MMAHILFIIICSLAAATHALPGTIFWVNTSVPVVTFQFDYCDVVRHAHVCKEGIKLDHESYNEGESYLCVTRPGNENCYYWSDVGWNTGTDWNYKPKEGRDRKDSKGRSLLTRMTLTRGRKIPWGRCALKNFFPLFLNIENPSPGDLGKYVLGAHIGTINPSLGIVELKDIKLKPTVAPSVVGSLKNNRDKTVQDILPIPGLSWQDVFSIETQTTPRKNLWIEWVRYTVRRANIFVGCIACAAANIHLTTIPLDLPEINHTECLLNLLKGENDTKCPELRPLLTPKPKGRPPGEVYVHDGNYTCFTANETTGTRMGIFGPGFCKYNSSIGSSMLQNLTHAVFDVFWLCGDGRLRNKLPSLWKGQCTLEKVIMPFRVLPWDPEVPDAESQPSSHHRQKRSALLRDFQQDPQVYIDAIGVPRGVPDEFKAQDQISAGFQSIIPQIQINKNVAWINYMYYNEQRFVNYSRDAFQGIVEELGPNTRMTLQNRFIIDREGTKEKRKGVRSSTPRHSGKIG